MTCEGIRDALRRGEAVDGGDSHVQQCDSCRELLQSPALWSGVGGGDAAAADDLMAAIGADIAAEGLRQRLMALATPWRLAVALGVAAVLVGLVGLATPRADLSIYPKARMALELLALAVAVIGAALLATRPLFWPPASGLWLGVTIAASLLVPLAIAVAWQAHADHPESLKGGDDDLIGRAVGCFIFGSVVALPVLGLLALFQRARGRAWTVAAAAALTGVASLVMHCPITLNVHQLLGHATVPVAFVALAVLVTAWRKNPSSM